MMTIRRVTIAARSAAAAAPCGAVTAASWSRLLGDLAMQVVSRAVAELARGYGERADVRLLLESVHKIDGEQEAAMRLIQSVVERTSHLLSPADRDRLFRAYLEIASSRQDRINRARISLVDTGMSCAGDTTAPTDHS